MALRLPGKSHSPTTLIASRFRSTWTLVALTVLVTISGRADTQNRPLNGVEVLSQFVGVWETHARIRHEGPPLREFQTRGRAVCQQTLHGRYVEFRAESIPPGRAELQIMTYETEAGLYRQWVFDSDGYRHQAEGRWDPTTATLTWQGTTEGSSFVIKDRWISPGRLEWTLLRRDAEGRRLQTIEGSLIRVKGD